MMSMVKMKGIMLNEIHFDKLDEVRKWKSVINHGILKHGNEWYKIQDTSFYFITTNYNSGKSNSKFELIKQKIVY